MKKQYLIPNTVTVLLETQPLMAFSDNGDGTLNGGGSKGNYGGSGQLSRQSGWSDDED